MISPCACRDIPDMIWCGGNTSIDLKKVFLKISHNLDQYDKHFEAFHLTNTAITELEDSIFDDVTFTSIIVEHANSFKRISANAFNNSIRSVQYLYLFIESGLGNEVFVQPL